MLYDIFNRHNSCWLDGGIHSVPIYPPGKSSVCNLKILNEIYMLALPLDKQRKLIEILSSISTSDYEKWESDVSRYSYDRVNLNLHLSSIFDEY